MDLSPSPGTPEHSRGPAPNMPPLMVDLSTVDSVLFVLERGRYGSALPNLLAAAALYRAIALERRGEPCLNVVGETQLTNWANRHGQIAFLENLHPNATTLFLSASAFSRRDYAAIAGMYQASDAILVGKPQLIDDSIPIGKRPDSRRPLNTIARALIGPRADEIVTELLDQADGIAPNAAAFHEMLQQSLSALQVRTGFLARRGASPIADPHLAIERFIVELAAGSRSPELLREYGPDYLDARELAQSIWDEAAELTPGVFELSSPGHRERDHLVRNCLSGIYEADPRARFVLERHDDVAPTALTPEEGRDFSLRLKMGEPPREILDDVAQLVRERRDNATAMHISLLEGRGRDERSILEPILERSQYRPDPGGVFTILKSPREFSLSTLVERRGFEVVEHNTLWLVDAQTGRPHPMAITFQASQLARFLRCVS